MVEKFADKMIGLGGERLFDFVNGHLLRVGKVDYRIMNDERVIAPLQNARGIGMVAKCGEVDADGFAGVIVDFSDDDPKVLGCLGRFGEEECIPAFERQSILPLELQRGAQSASMRARLFSSSTIASISAGSFFWAFKMSA